MVDPAFMHCRLGGAGIRMAGQPDGPLLGTVAKNEDTAAPLVVGSGTNWATKKTGVICEMCVVRGTEKKR